MKKYEAYTNRSNYGKVRVVVTEDGDIFYSATDVARAMGYRSPRDAVQTHCEGVQSFFHRAGAGFQSMNFIDWLEVPFLAAGMPTERALDVHHWLCKDLPLILIQVASGKMTQPRFLTREGIFCSPGKNDEVDAYLDEALSFLNQILERDAKKGGGAYGRTPAVHER